MKIWGWRRMGTVLFSVMAIGTTRYACAEQTSPYAFATEYVRELYETEKARASAEQEIRESTSPDEQDSSIIHASTLIKLELASQIGMLKDMHLNSPFDTLLPNIIELYQEKIELHQKMIDTAKVFLAGPKPNVNYGDLAAKVPEIRASLDDIDHTLFKVTQMVLLQMMDQRPDFKNHLSHLLVTKAERSKLINDIEIEFGEKLDRKGQNYGVSSAQLIHKTFFKKITNAWTILGSDYLCQSGQPTCSED